MTRQPEVAQQRKRRNPGPTPSRVPTNSQGRGHQLDDDCPEADPSGIVVDCGDRRICAVALSLGSEPEDEYCPQQGTETDDQREGQGRLNDADVACPPSPAGVGTW